MPYPSATTYPSAVTYPGIPSEDLPEPLEVEYTGAAQPVEAAGGILFETIEV